jgi:1-acyl-sn-glycerol-3-phosphate acyltransferase
VGRQPEELMQEVEDWIESEMRRLDPESYTDGPALAVAQAHPSTDQDIDA